MQPPSTLRTDQPREQFIPAGYPEEPFLALSSSTIFLYLCPAKFQPFSYPTSLHTDERLEVDFDRWRKGV